MNGRHPDVVHAVVEQRLALGRPERIQREVRDIAFHRVLGVLAKLGFEHKAGNDPASAQGLGKALDPRGPGDELLNPVTEAQLVADLEGIVGQGPSGMAFAAAERPEVGVLERQVGAQEHVQPEQRIRIARLTRPAGLYHFASGRGVAATSLDRHADPGDHIGIPLEVPDLGEAGLHAVRVVLSLAIEQIHRDPRLAALSEVREGIGIRVEELVLRGIIRDQDVPPNLYRQPEEQGHVRFHLGELVGVFQTIINTIHIAKEVAIFDLRQVALRDREHVPVEAVAAGGRPLAHQPGATMR